MSSLGSTMALDVKLREVRGFSSSVLTLKRAIDRVMSAVQELGTAMDSVTDALKRTTSFSSRVEIRTMADAAHSQIHAFREGRSFFSYNSEIHSDVLRKVKSLESKSQELERIGKDQLKLLFVSGRREGRQLHDSRAKKHLEDVTRLTAQRFDAGYSELTQQSENLGKILENFLVTNLKFTDAMKNTLGNAIRAVHMTNTALPESNSRITNESFLAPYIPHLPQHNQQRMQHGLPLLGLRTEQYVDGVPDAGPVYGTAFYINADSFS